MNCSEVHLQYMSISELCFLKKLFLLATIMPLAISVKTKKNIKALKASCCIDPNEFDRRHPLPARLTCPKWGIRGQHILQDQNLTNCSIFTVFLCDSHHLNEKCYSQKCFKSICLCYIIDIYSRQDLQTLLSKISDVLMQNLNLNSFQLEIFDVTQTDTEILSLCHLLIYYHELT